MAAQRKTKKKFQLDEHILIPKHEVLKDKDKEILFEKYHISAKELPKILKNDPAIKALNAKPGDIIKISRNDPTAGDT